MTSKNSKSKNFKKTLPNFSSLPHLPNYPNYPGCAWNVWSDFDKSGEEDDLGTVNMLNEEVVSKAAREEIRKGRTVGLNWSVHLPVEPAFNRSPAIHTIISRHGGSLPARDDLLSLNTQSGSQWDGLRHFGTLVGVNPSDRCWYQGVKPDRVPLEERNTLRMAELRGDFDSENNYEGVLEKKGRNGRLGIHHWAEHGIVSRGLFLDLPRYFNKIGRKPIDPFDRNESIKVNDLVECAKYQGIYLKNGTKEEETDSSDTSSSSQDFEGYKTKVRNGDILLIRFGFIENYERMLRLGDEGRKELNSLVARLEFTGLEQSDEMKAFLWNNHFAAVASDLPPLERWPPPEKTPFLHETIITLWGMPLGELFYLEELAKVCEEEERWSCFFSSWPLNVFGGIASPPNASAIL